MDSENEVTKGPGDPEEGESGEREEILSRRKGKSRLITYAVVIVIVIGMIPAGLYIKKSIDSRQSLKLQQAGISYLEKGEYKGAEEEFKKAIEQNPDKFEPHYGLGLAYLKVGKLAPAAKELITAIKLNPASIEAHYSLGVTFQQMGKFDLAMEEYFIVMKALKEKKLPPAPELYDNIGLIYLSQKEYDKAVYAFKRATQISGNYYPAYINLGKAYEAQGKKDLAIKEYQKVQQMASLDPRTSEYAKIAEEMLANLRKRGGTKAKG